MFYVIEGGSLLHGLQWKAGDSYDAIAQDCHYGLANVGFDGYGGSPSIKDNTRGHDVHPVVHFTAETELSGKCLFVKS